MFRRIWVFVIAALLAGMIGFACLVAGFVLLAQIASFLFVAVLITGLVMAIRGRSRRRP